MSTSKRNKITWICPCCGAINRYESNPPINPGDEISGNCSVCRASLKITLHVKYWIPQNQGSAVNIDTALKMYEEYIKDYQEKEPIYAGEIKRMLSGFRAILTRDGVIKPKPNACLHPDEKSFHKGGE
jgi:RNase P subunit RPR2